MLKNQVDLSGANPIGQTNRDSMTESSQPAATPTVAAARPTAEGSIHVAPASSSTLRPETQVSKTLVGQMKLPDLQIHMAQNGLQTALIAMALLLALIVVWQLRRRRRSDGSRFEILAAEPDSLSGWPSASTQKKKGELFAYGKYGDVKYAAASSGRNHFTPENDQEDEDTSKLLTEKPQSGNDFDFDDDVTYLHTPKADRRLVGHLIRVTSEPRLPAELALYGSSPLLSAEGQIAIGRHSKHNTVVISDKSVSREHAAIVQRSEQLFVRDKASTAGTLLNWQRLRADEELPLQHNDILILGEAVYEFRVQAEEDHRSHPSVPESAQDDTELIGK